MEIKQFNQIGKEDNLEYVQFEFLLEGINRFQSTLICELKGSYVQQSQRYVEMNNTNIYLPIVPDEEGMQLIEDSFELYNRMTELNKKLKQRPIKSDFKYGIPYEDARYILPLAVTTNIQCSLNGEQLLNLLELFKIYPVVFRDMKDQIELLIPLSLLELSRTKKQEMKDVFTELGGEDLLLSKTENILILNHTKNMVNTVGLGALTSTTKGSPLQKLKSDMSNIVERVMDYGHTSIAEQVTIQSALTMSLVTYHQFIRHRLGVNIREKFSNLREFKNDFIIPPSINESKFKDEYIHLANRYIKYRSKLDNDFGMLYLINADMIRLFSKTNARIDIDIAKERTCLNAQWEVRSLYEKKIKYLSKISPILFKDALPPCVYGRCPEGALSCGKQLEVKEYYGLEKTL